MHILNRQDERHRRYGGRSRQFQNSCGGTQGCRSRGYPQGKGSSYGRMAGAYLRALLEEDRRIASQRILDAAKRSSSVRDLYLQVLLPSQKEFDHMWVSAEIDVVSICAGPHANCSVTASDRAQVVEPDSDFARRSNLLIGRHPHLESFVHAESSPLVRIDIHRYFVVGRFQEVPQWAPDGIANS